MAEYKWPEPEKRTLIGKRISRVDGPDKVSGKAKYTYDINRPGMLHGKILRSPYAHAKITKHRHVAQPSRCRASRPSRSSRDRALRSSGPVMRSSP